MQIDKEITDLERQIEGILHQMHEVIIPNQGSSLIFHQAYEEKRVCLDMIDCAKKQIAQLKFSKQQKFQERRGYDLELEKMNFLQQKEVREFLKKIKNKEQKELDDIANMQFVRRINEENN